MELNMDSYYSYLNALSNDTIKTSNYQGKQLSSLFNEDNSSVSSDFDTCLLSMINESKDTYQIIADTLISNMNSTNGSEYAKNTSDVNSEFQSLLTAYQNLSSNIISNLYSSASLEESLFSTLNNDSSTKANTVSSLFQSLTNSENTAETPIDNSKNTQSDKLQLASAILNGFSGQNTSSYYLSNLLTNIISNNTTT